MEEEEWKAKFVLKDQGRHGRDSSGSAQTVGPSRRRGSENHLDVRFDFEFSIPSTLPPSLSAP